MAGVLYFYLETRRQQQFVSFFFLLFASFFSHGTKKFFSFFQCLLLSLHHFLENIQTNNSTHRFTRPLDSRFFEQNVNNTQKAKYRNSSTPALPPVLRKNLLCIHLLLIFPRQSFSVPSSEIIKKDSILFSSQEKKIVIRFFSQMKKTMTEERKTLFCLRGGREGGVNWRRRRLFF